MSAWLRRKLRLVCPRCGAAPVSTGPGRDGFVWSRCAQGHRWKPDDETPATKNTTRRPS